MEARLESVEQESKENHDRFLRVSAEFENYKKRAAREMGDFRKFANESFVKAMLPVVDNLDRAIESSSNDKNTSTSVVEGVNMTLIEILKVFEQFGVIPFESLGKTFDPGFHQAVMQEENEDYPDNTVLNEMQKGYMIHDRLLRPAMVVVSKKKERPENQEVKAEEKKET
jgi:molecular chaperone GrpE